MKQPKIVVTSGGFDPVHIGHTRLFKEAKKLGDKHIVIMNNDNWLMKKKGFVFMPQIERKELLEALRDVDEVYITNHPKNPTDMSICEALRKIKPDIFANGGDRNVQDAANPKSSLNADVLLCQKMDIKIVYNVGQGGKIQSSSWLVEKFQK